MAGGSHTDFNHEAFTVGAVGGALTLAGAVVSGAVNHRRQQQIWNAQQWRAAFELSQAFRADDHRKLRAAAETVAAQNREIADLRRRVRTAQANALRR